MDMSFYNGKKVLITGHTGFKGSWMCKLLIMAGAKVTGYALEAPTDPSLFEMCRIADGMNSVSRGYSRSGTFEKGICRSTA